MSKNSLKNVLSLKWLLLQYILSFSVALTLVGCEKPTVEKPDQPDSLTKITIAQSPQPLATLSIIAYKKGFYREEGLDVSIKEFTTGKLCFDAMLGGGADFATVAETPLMYAGFSNHPISIIATIVSSPLSAKVIARKDKGISTPDDLKGKPVGTFKGGSAEYFFSQFLLKHDLTLEDLRVTYMAPPELVTAIIRGDLAAISMWEPHISIAQKAIGEKDTIIFTGEDIYTETYEIVLRKDFAKENPETVKKLLRGLIKAEILLKENPDEAKKIILEAISIDQDILDRIWPHYDFRVRLDQSVLDQIKAQATFAIKNEKVPAGSQMPDYENMFDANFMRQIEPTRVKFD